MREFEAKADVNFDVTLNPAKRSWFDTLMVIAILGIALYFAFTERTTEALLVIIAGELYRISERLGA